MGSPAPNPLAQPIERPAFQPHSALAARALRVALGAAHGCLAPRPRERFVQEPAPRAHEEVWYRSDDGWRCRLFRCPPPPGAPGEPVIVAHGLGFNRLSLDYAPDDGIVPALHARGFDVFLLEHRGDASALPPRDARPYDADTIAAQDLPAAIDAVLAHTGQPRAAWVGHGLGGQLLYLLLAQDPHCPLFAAASLGAAVRFPASASTARTAELVARLLPARLGLPARQVLRLLSPGAGAGRGPGALPSPGALAGPELRGLLNHGIEDLEGGLIRQLARWVASGGLCDARDRIDYLEALRGHPLPVMVLSATDDAICPPEAALAALDALGPGCEGRVLTEPCGHLGLVRGQLSREVVGPALATWLGRHRRAS